MPSASYVFPVRYVSEGVAVQTTSRELSPLGIMVRSLAPPQVGARVSMALYLPNTTIPEVAIARVSRSRAGGPGDSGFWADFIVVDPQARMRISSLLADGDEAETQHRTFPRISVKLEVRFRTASEFVQQHAMNLARGGIFIQTDDLPPVDAAVEVEVHLPDGGAPVTTAGIVVHRQTAAPGRVAGVGVQFVDASDTFRERLDRYMDSLVKD
ncbi:MAG TPA: TIGR02266 family protein [Myxococcales bacterium]|nr:TIGR02266 family protein [Myxococcales bacterium]